MSLRNRRTTVVAHPDRVGRWGRIEPGVIVPRGRTSDSGRF
jgi:hypothetical protein